jgi:hypothetical protein
MTASSPVGFTGVGHRWPVRRRIGTLLAGDRGHPDVDDSGCVVDSIAL